MTSFMSGFLFASVLAATGSSLSANRVLIIAITLWITGFLCILNISLAVFFRKRARREVLSYCAACILELVIFAGALLFFVGVFQSVPFHLPPGLPFNQGEIAAALSVGIGLFPAAYWHRINLSELPERIAEDGRSMKEHNAGVSVRKGTHGEWMN